MCLGVYSLKGYPCFDNMFGNSTLYEKNLRFLHRIGTSAKAGKRQVVMSSFGCTMSASTTPRMLLEDGKTMFIPRPYANFRPFTNTHKQFNLNLDLRKLVLFIEEWCLRYLIDRREHEEWADKAFFDAMQVYELVPRSCRIYDSIFTYMSINGDLKGPTMGIGKHIDQDDMFDFVLHIGDDGDDGATLYFESKESNKIVTRVQFVNGKCQFGNFGKVYHGTEEWKCNRCSITLATKTTVLNSFREYGEKPFNDCVVRNRFLCPNVVVDGYKKIN